MSTENWIIAVAIFIIAVLIAALIRTLIKLSLGDYDAHRPRVRKPETSSTPFDTAQSSNGVDFGDGGD